MKYALKTTSGEVIARGSFFSLDEAVTFFAKVKKLPEESLLGIYSVEKID